ncbi:MAG: hypothetical protein JW703_02240 [Candidatus Diapherotrites archaeon]|nr:hypothetical protein [Candidatus Diapherotrites archaeon]
MDSRKTITLFVLFALSYLFLWVFSGFSVFLHEVFENIPLINALTNAFFPLAQWDLSGFPLRADYMLLLLPIAGFFFIYFLIDWINDFFETKFALSYWFPLVLFGFSLIAWHLVLMVYFGNISFLNSNVEIPFDSIAYFRNSAFCVFILAGILGWVSKKIMLLIDSRK